MPNRVQGPDKKSDWELLTKRMDDGRWMGEMSYRKDTIWIGDADTKQELRDKAIAARYDLAWNREELPEDENPFDGAHYRELYSGGPEEMF